MEKCIDKDFYQHFAGQLTSSQHCFVYMSTLLLMLSFLKKSLKALDKDSTCYVFAFYTDFLKAFVKMLYRKLLKKFGKTGVGWCLIDIRVHW